MGGGVGVGVSFVIVLIHDLCSSVLFLKIFF